MLLSFIAISLGDVIKHPFNTAKQNSVSSQFVEIIIAINIGRYLFSIVENLSSKRHVRRVKFRSDLIHHVVAVICYSFFLFSGENLLLGLIGVLIEASSIFEDVRREFQDSEKTHLAVYRRVLIIGCVFNVCFRGIIPIVFLTIAMFEQSPFAMTNVTLLVFFFSMIFFSVINVWQILSSIQKLLSYIIERPRERYKCPPDQGIVRGTRQLEYCKNYLGYLRPYNNKNLAYQIDNEKDNLNNKKDVAKDTIKLHLDPATYYTENKAVDKKNTCTEAHQTVVSSESTLELQEVILNNENSIQLQTINSCSVNDPLRISNSSSDTTGSDQGALLQSNLV